MKKVIIILVVIVAVGLIAYAIWKKYGQKDDTTTNPTGTVKDTSTVSADTLLNTIASDSVVASGTATSNASADASATPSLA